MAGRWMVTYDVSQARARTQLATMLEARGPRVLYSVFEIDAGAAELDGLVARARGLLRPSDRLLCLPVCQGCRQWRFGQPIERDPADSPVVYGL